MDLIYSGTKINKDGTATPGNEFRKCFPSDEVQSAKPIIGLPHNFYDVKWLRTLSPNQLVVLNIQPEIDINFTIDERKYVLFATDFSEVGVLLTLKKDTQ